MPAIEVKNLYKIFGSNKGRVFPLLEQGKSKEDILAKTGCTVGISNASFTIEQGETFVVMGLSGSGKSTVLRCLNRIIEPTRGKVLVEGSDIMKMSREQLLQVRRKKMSMVFQHFALLPHRTVLKNVEYGLEVSGVDKDIRTKSAYEALELVGLKGYENSMPGELSGGMKQRVGLARALANNAEILLMDEAFSALDPLIRAQMQDELLELQSRVHKTIVFITHDLDEALKLGDRIVIMRDGAVVQIGSPEEILTKPADEYVAKFVQNVDRTKVISASSIMHRAPTITAPREGPQVAIRRMEKHGVSTLYVTNANRQLLGILTIDSAVELAKSGRKDLSGWIVDNVYTTTEDTPIADLVGTAISTKYPLVVLDKNNHFCGIVDRASIIAEFNRETDTDGAVIPLEQTLESSITLADNMEVDND
ncbi:MAG: betaine/proline/choline family ABC transporter ATP-binding protein [Chitinivibrionales bacterium]|nr:betaine/proline/choline family ABC transporter ATP-binding protein [Chitinivibrionales bacterium]MBD3357199.1 betaine/proline/choline family ABC transporter ATP-binding protein [Chitinivibrionales bacterium]